MLSTVHRAALSLYELLNPRQLKVKLQVSWCQTDWNAQPSELMQAQMHLVCSADAKMMHAGHHSALHVL